MGAMSRRTKYLGLAGILIIATFLRFYHLTTVPPGLYPDEAINGNNAAAAAATGHYQAFYPENNGREGLYVDLIGLEFQFFHAPHEPWVVRLPAAIAGVLTVLGLYLLVAELFGDGAGLLAAFLIAASFWAVNFSRIGFRAILAPLFLTWALWLFVKAVRAPAASDAPPAAPIVPTAPAAARRAWRFSRGAWYAVFAGIVYALGFYTYIAYRITPLLFLLFIPFFKTHPHFWKRAALFIAAAFVAAAPIGWYFAGHPADFFGRTSEISVASAGNPIVQFAVNAGKELLMFNFRGDANWRQNVSGAPELFFPVGILFLLGIAVGIWSLAQHKRRGLARLDPEVSPEISFPPFAVLLAFAWLILGLLPAALSNEAIPHALRSILALPPAIILAAMGGVWLYRIIKNRRPAAAFAVALFFFAAVAAAGYIDYFLVWAQNPNVPGAFAADYVAIGRAINVLPASTPKYVVVEAGGVPVDGIPMPAQTTMFVTDTFTPAGQTAKDVRYLLPGQTSMIPPGTPRSDIFYIR